MADALLMGYSDPNWQGPTIVALVETLLGNSPVGLVADDKTTKVSIFDEMHFNVLDVISCPTGKLPLTLEPFYPAGYSLSYLSQSIKSVEWDFGNGKQSKGDRVSHTYTKPGKYVVGVKIKTEDGEEISGSYQLQVEAL